MRTTLAELIYDRIKDLRRRVPDLRDSLQPGPRRWQAPPDMPDVVRAAMAERDRAERADKETIAMRGLAALGASPAPIRIDVLDAIDQIARDLRALEADVCDFLGLTPLAGADVGDRLTRLVGLQDRIDESLELSAKVLEQLGRMVRRVDRALGDGDVIHKLEVRCPICEAVSLRRISCPPAKGQREDRQRVVCINPGCRCGDDDCYCHEDPPRRHWWRMDQWELSVEALDGAA